MGAWIDNDLKRRFVELTTVRGFEDSAQCQEHLIQTFVDSAAVPPFVSPTPSPPHAKKTNPTKIKKGSTS